MPYFFDFVSKRSSKLIAGLVGVVLIAGAAAAFATGAPTITSVATDNIINSVEKSNVSVSGTVVDPNNTSTNTNVFVTITDAGALHTASSLVLPVTTSGTGGTFPFTVSGINLSAAGFVDGPVNVTATANDGDGSPTTSVGFAATINTVAPTVVSAKVTGPNQFTVVYSTAVQSVAGDYTNITVDSIARGAASGVSGSGTATIVVTFSGAPAATSATGSVDISAGVVTLIGNPFAAATQPLTDGQAPTLSEVTPVPTPKNVTTPNYTFSASETGTISYAGDCSSATTPGAAGNNTVSFAALVAGLHNNCTVQVTDASGNVSSLLPVTPFTIDLTLPTFTAQRTGVNTVDLTFSEAVTADTTATAWTLTAPFTVSSVVATDATHYRLNTAGGVDTFTTPTVNYVAGAGNVLDLAGNEVANGGAIVAADKVAPTLSSVTIASNNPVPTLARVGNTVTVTFTSSEPISSPTVTINGAAATTVSGGPTAWTASRPMVGGDIDGPMSFVINFADTPGANAGVAVTAITTGSNVTFDKTAPVLTQGLPFLDSFVKSSSLITFTDGELTAPKCQVTGGALTTCVTGVTTLGDLNNFAAVPEGAFTLTLTDTDPAGNVGTVTRNLIKDTAAPTATGLPTAAAGPLINAAEQTAGFTVVVPLGTSGAVAGDTLDLLLNGSTFTAPLSVTLSATDVTNGTHSFTVAAGQLGADGAKSITARVTDQAGNASPLSPVLALTLDTVAPTASIGYSTSNPVKSGAALTITATFSEAMAGAPVPQVAISGSNTVAATNMTLVDATHYTFADVIGAGNGVATVALSTGTDLAGNPITAVPTLGATFVVDNTIPIIAPVTIASNNGVTSLAKVGDTVTLTFTTSESAQTPTVTIGLAPATVSGGPTAWTASRAMVGGDTSGVVAFTIDALDIAGNAAAQVTAVTAGSNVTFDKTAPVLSETTPVVTPRNNTTPSYTFTSGEAGTVVYGGDCSTTASGAVPSGPTTVAFNTLSAGTHSNCTVRVTDTAGNASSLLPVTSFVIDTTAPTITSITSTTADGSYKVGAAINLTINFSEAVSSAGATLTTNTGGACTTGVIASATTASCTYTVAGGQNAADLDVVTVAGSISDTATNVLTNFVPATTLASARAIVVDTIAPTISPVSIASNNASTTLAKTGNVVTLSFSTSEAVAAPVVTIRGTAVGVVVSGGPVAWTATRTMLVGDTEGTVPFTINASDAAANAATQASAITTGANVVFDRTAPVVTEFTPVSTPTNNNTPSWTFATTEAGSIAYTTCISPTLAAAVGNNTVAFNTLPDAAYPSCSITVTDAAGNTSASRAVSAFTVDTVAPTVTSVSSTVSNGAFTTGASIPVTVTFSEPVTSTGNVTLTFNTVGGPAATCTVAIAGSSTGTCNYVVSAGQTAADLNATVSGTIRDAASNLLTNFTPGTTLATNKDIVIDTTAPTVVSVTTVKADGFYPVGTTVDFSILFSEPVTVTGTPKISLNSGGFADVISGSGTNTLVARYTVGATDNSADLDYNLTTSFGVAGTIVDIATNPANRTLPAVGTIAGAHAIVIDTTAPTATLAATAAAGPLINATENTAGFSVVVPLGSSGAVAGDSLALLLGGAAFPTPLTRTLSAGDIATGSFSFTVASGQLGSDGAKFITSRVTDQAGNVGAQSAQLALTLDTVAPVAPTITAIATDNEINNAEKAAILVAGSAEANAFVSATLTDGSGNSKNVTQQLAGGATAFSISVNGITAAPSAFVDGVVLPTVTATDAAGNTSLPATLPGVIQDTIAPAAPVVSLTNPVNIANVAAVAISGTGEGNTTVNYTITSTTVVSGSATTSVGGVISIPGVNISSIADGTATLSVTLTDSAGNVSGAGTATATKDTVVPVFSALAPANNAFINNVTTASAVGYTLSEALSSGTVVFTRTGGAADASSPRTCTLAGTAKNSGAHVLNVADTTNGCTVAQSLVDGAIYSVAFSGSDIVTNPSVTSTKTGITFDITAPIVSITAPLPSITTTPSVNVSATTNESATCTLVLDSATSTMTTGGTTHTKSLSGLAVGSHQLALSCADPATNTTLTSTQSFNVFALNGSTLSSNTDNAVIDSSIAGEADLPSGVTALALGNTNLIDLSRGVSLVGGGSITLAGTSQSLSSVTTGDLVGQNLSLPITVGDQTLTVGQGVVLFSGSLVEGGSPIIVTNSTLPGVTVSVPNGTAVFSSSAWDGTIAPGRATSTGGNAPAGFTISNEITFGAPQSLIFSKAVTITLDTIASPLAYKVAGSNTWIPFTTCLGTFASPTSPSFAGECSISDTVSTKILTYHLTSFAILTPVPPTPATNSGSNGPTGPIGGGGGGGGGGGIFIPATARNTTPTTGGSNGPIQSTKPAGSVLGVTAFRFTRNLSLGIRGADVTELQKVLIKEGFFKVGTTTYFGPATRAAVILYQKSHKIQSTGGVGPLTRVALNASAQ